MKVWILVCIVLLLFPFLLRAEDHYVAFTTSNDLWVLKIDSAGKVLESHRQHLDYFSAALGITPVQTKSGSALGIFTTENAVDVTLIESALFQHGTFTPFQNFQGKVLSEAGVLQVTQKSQANWLLARSRFSRLYQGFGINANQQWNGKSWVVSPDLPGSIVTASVSAGGRMLVESVATQSNAFSLVNQPLGADGHRQGKAAVIPIPELASAVDCSNVLSDGKRDVVYRVTKVDGIDTVESQVLLQRVNAGNGNSTDGAKPMTSTENAVVTIGESSQSLAVDPQGAFIVYTAIGSSCGRKILKFQRLSEDGSRNGPPVVLFGCSRLSNTLAGVVSVDLSRVPLP